MLTITKVLNSSVVLVKDEKGKEQIVLQKGVGYGRKPGEVVELGSESKIFVPVIPDDRQHMIQLLEEVPAEYPEITRDAVLYAEQVLGHKLNPHIYLTLTDHLHFAVKRIEMKMVITNRVMWEIKTFYKKEYKIGEYVIGLVKAKVGVNLPEDEAANIAFHLINAQNEDAQGDAMKDAKLIGQIVQLASYTMKYKPDKESIHYSRFISHLQYFVQRLSSGNMLDSEDDFMYSHMLEGYPKAVDCAEKVRTLVLKNEDKFISNEEVAYLAVHIQRLVTK